MKIFIAAIAFAITISGLVLFNNFKAPAKSQDYAQIVDALKNQSSPTNTAIPKPTNKTKGSKTPIPSKTTPTPSSTLIIALSTSVPTKTPVPTNSPSNSPVKLALQTTASPTPTPSPSSSGSPAPSLSPSPNSGPAVTSSPSATPTPTLTPSPTSSGSPTSSPSTSVTPSPETSSQPSDYSITALILTSPIARGNTAELKIQTTSGATCSIKFTLPSGSVSSAQGLQTKTTDNTGIIDWQWKIGGSTKPSPPDAKIDLNCSKDSNVYSGYLQMTITQ